MPDSAGDGTGRRDALGKLAAGGLAVAAAAAGLGGSVGMLLDPVLRPGSRNPGDGWLPVGRADLFAPGGEPRLVVVRADLADGWVTRSGVPVGPVLVDRLADGAFRVLSGLCPHLGCSVAWSKDRGLFACPCHRSAFARDGGLAAPGPGLPNPSPRGLDPLDWRVVGGVLEVRWQRYRTGTPDRIPVG